MVGLVGENENTANSAELELGMIFGPECLNTNFYTNLVLRECYTAHNYHNTVSSSLC